MPKHYSLAPTEVAIMVEEMVHKYHPEVKKAGVKIDLLSISHDDEDKPALTLHGYPCAAVIRVVGVKERTKGAGDVEIVINESRWHEMELAQQRALIDHELYHIVVKMQKEDPTKVQLDCRGRPKIGMRKHTVNLGWFDVIAKRHGNASFEVQQAHGIFLEYKQAFFPFIESQKALGA